MTCWPRTIVTWPSSSGWRSASRLGRANSESSSRKSTPRCASVASPGCGGFAPPTSPAAEIVWCGARNGRAVTRPRAAAHAGDRLDARDLDRLVGAERRQDRRQPARDHRLAGARAAPAGTGCGRRPRRPRGRESARCGRGRRRSPAPARRLSGSSSGRPGGSSSPFSVATSSSSDATPTISMSGTSAASRARAAGSTSRRSSCRRTPSATASAPADRPHLAGQRQLADDGARLDRLGVELRGRDQQRDRQRQIERRADLAQVRRREVDRDPPERELEARS